jgi:ABC-type sugar transport system ATPase subunit
LATIVLDDVWKTYADGTEAVRALDLEVADGEFVVLVGPSGCGKTTALRMIAGLEAITKGEVRIGDRVASVIASSTTCRRRSGTSRWCSRTTRSTRT